MNILVAHLYLASHAGEKLEEPEGERPVLDIGGAQAVFLDNLPNGVQYVALGHLHRRIKMQHRNVPVIYSGSPLSYSMSEADQDKAVTIVDLEPGKGASAKEVLLHSGRKVHRKTSESVTDAITWLEVNRNTLVELTIISDTYLSADQRKALYSTHDGIVDIIPQLKDAQKETQAVLTPANLSKSVEDLFKEYFEHDTTQAPNDEMIDLLREIMKAEEE